MKNYLYPAHDFVLHGGISKLYDKTICCLQGPCCQINPIALRKAKIVYNFGLFECNRVKDQVTVHTSAMSIGYNENLFQFCLIFKFH